MDKTEHAIVGALLGLATYGLHKLKKNEDATIHGAVGSLLLGGFAGVLPDLLEPPISPNHRSFFHSIAFFTMLVGGNQKTWLLENATDDEKLVISVFSVGYGSHLVLDGCTPKSIPFLGIGE